MIIIDSGGANLASLQFALERLGAHARVSSDAAEIAGAARLILPGVGSARNAMQRLESTGLIEPLRRFARPVLGICLGMQLLHEASEEGDTRCLGIIPGTATRFAAEPGLPVPHMGWNTLRIERASALLSGIDGEPYAYFVHSYRLAPSAATTASCLYGAPFGACVAWRNFHGTQFHPERSAALGARVLGNFLNLPGGPDAPCS